MATVQRTVSLQKKLVKSSILGSVIAGLIAFLLLLGISIYQTMSVQDEIMDEISDMLLITDISNVSGSQLDELSEEFEIQYQLKHQNQLLTQSEDFNSAFSNLSQSNKNKDYDFIWHDHQLWRTYIQSDHDMVSFVIQPIKYRLKDLLNTFVIYLAILLLLWAIQWIFIHFTLKHQFKSFNLLTKQISEKSADDLAPIQHRPVEFQELQPMIHQLNQLLARLQQSLAAEQRFTADASHELRSPLSAIQMRLQLLNRKYAADEVIQKDLKQIQQDVSRGTLVLENLLLLARLDPSKTNDLPKSKTNLKTLIEDVIHALKPFIDEKQIKIHADISSNIQPNMNKELIFTCVRNVVDNAIRYIPVNGEINIQVNELSHQVEIIITDNGNSVTDETIQRLGERFYRALGTKTTGSGLGLSICQKIIELHQGHIEFIKNEHCGLTVKIYLSTS